MENYASTTLVLQVWKSWAKTTTNQQLKDKSWEQPKGGGKRLINVRYRASEGRDSEESPQVKEDSNA